jgi:hypothetical protein
MWNKASGAAVPMLQADAEMSAAKQLTEGHPLPKDMDSSIN